MAEDFSRNEPFSSKTMMRRAAMVVVIQPGLRMIRWKIRAGVSEEGVCSFGRRSKAAWSSALPEGRPLRGRYR